MNPTQKIPMRAGTGHNQNNTVKETTSETRRAVRTPRFVFGSSGPSGSAKQFAATPRFAFSQKEQNESRDEIDESDESFSPVNRANNPAKAGLDDTQIIQKEVIADSEEESDNDLLLLEDNGTKEIPQPGGAHSDFSDAFGRYAEEERPLSASPSQHRPKRRCISITSVNQEELKPTVAKGADRISSSPSPPPLSPTSSSAEMLDDGLVSPTVRRMPSTPFQPPGAVRVNQHSATQRPPRFTFTPTLPQSPWPPDRRDNDPGSTATEPSTQRPKPRFILPHTPSKVEELNISALLTSPVPFPFSKRHGRSKPRAHNFVLDGMAFKVQNWILELGAAKHIAQTQATVPLSGSTQVQIGQGTSHHDGEKYQFVAQVGEVRTMSSGRDQGRPIQTKPGHLAPFTLVSPSEIQPPTELNGKNMLLFGSPAFSTIRPMESLQKGDWIGLRPGLIWEMELEPLGSNKPPSGDDAAEHEIGSTAKEWIVGMEWDIIRTING